MPRAPRNTNKPKPAADAFFQPAAAAAAQPPQPQNGSRDNTNYTLQLPAWLPNAMPGLSMFGANDKGGGGGDYSAQLDTHIKDGDGQWAHGLIEYSDACVYLYATGCSCFVLYHTYSESTRHVHQDALVLQRNDPLTSGLACLLSACLCVDCAVCSSQTTLRTLDKAADLYQSGSGGNDDEGDGLFGTLVRWFQTTPHWMSDGEGYEADPNTSEDWFPAHYCCHYAGEMSAAMWECRACCCGAPRLPTCLVLSMCVCYPFLVCPLTLLMRLYVVRTRYLSEPCCVSAATSLLCAPCAIVQMDREVSSSSSAAHTSAPLMTNHLRSGPF